MQAGDQDAKMGKVEAYIGSIGSLCAVAVEHHNVETTLATGVWQIWCVADT